MFKELSNNFEKTLNYPLNLSESIYTHFEERRIFEIATIDKVSEVVKVEKPNDKKLKEFYDLAEFAIQLPLGTSMNHFKRKYKVNLIARHPTKDAETIREQNNIIKSSPCVLFALGGSKNKILFKHNDDVQIICLNTRIDTSIPAKDLSDITEGQDLVSISDLVICKCGYGLISECLTNGIPFFYVADDAHPEQMAIHNDLLKRGFDNRITFDEINQLDLSPKFIKNTPQISRESIELDNTINHILNFIKN